jgi:hypothetical protein
MSSDQLGLGKLTDEQFYNLFTSVVQEMYNRDSVVANSGQLFIDRKKAELEERKKILNQQLLSELGKESIDLVIADYTDKLKIEIRNTARLWVAEQIARGNICLLTNQQKNQEFEKSAFDCVIGKYQAANPEQEDSRNNRVPNDRSLLLKEIKSLIPSSVTKIVAWSGGSNTNISRIFFNSNIKATAELTCSVDTISGQIKTFTGNLSETSDIERLKELLKAMNFKRGEAFYV